MFACGKEVFANHANLFGELVSLAASGMPCFAAYSWHDVELMRGNYAHGRTILDATGRGFDMFLTPSTLDGPVGLRFVVVGLIGERE